METTQLTTKIGPPIFIIYSMRSELKLVSGYKKFGYKNAVQMNIICVILIAKGVNAIQ